MIYPLHKKQQADDGLVESMFSSKTLLFCLTLLLITVQLFAQVGYGLKIPAPMSGNTDSDSIGIIFSDQAYTFV